MILPIARNLVFYLKHSHGLIAKLKVFLYGLKKTAQKMHFYDPPLGNLSQLILGGFPIYFNTTSAEAYVFNEIFVQKVYELHEEFIPQPGWTILDIGANIGLFALRNSQRIKQGKIYSIEPNPFVYSILLKNIFCNKLLNVKTFKVAIGEKSGKMNIHFNPKQTVSGTLVASFRVPGSDISVETKMETMDEFTKNNCIFGNIDLIKMDIEGAELGAIQNGKETLRRTKRIIMECHDKNIQNEISEELSDLSFHCILAKSYPVIVLYYLHK